MAISNLKAPVSPFSTGGGGYRFEFLVATYYMISLLKMEFARGVEKGIVRAVKLQQRNRGYLVDDLIVTAEDGVDERTLALQIKHTFRFANNRDFREVIEDCWGCFSQTTFKRSLDRVGIGISESSNIRKVRKHLQEFLRWAVTSNDAQAFYDKVKQFKAKQGYLELFETALNDIAGERLPETEILAFLKSFIVIPFDFDDPGSRDSLNCLNNLLTLLEDKNPSHVRLLFSSLYDLASRYAASGGEIDANVLARELPQSLRLQPPSILSEELRPVRECLINHLTKQIAREKNSKKYIPDVFVEVSHIKDQARYFTRPVLFLHRVVETVSRLDFSGINRILLKLSLEPIHLELPDSFKPTGIIDEIENQCAFLLSVLQAAKNAVNIFSERDPELPLEAIPAEKRYIYEEMKYPLRWMGASLERQIDECVDDLKTIQSRVLFLIARAGQGKTNFVCDFAENVLLKCSLPCLFFTGREFNYVNSDNIDEYIVRSVFGDKYDGNIGAALRDLERLSLTDQAPVTIIIDGINEHKDISDFSHRLERLIEQLLEYRFVNVILTCRSEYFDQRFTNFREASFADEICFVENMERYMTAMHKDHLIESYFRFFNLQCPYLSPRAREALKDDTLLLRMFCEAYGDHTAKDIIHLPQIMDIYKDEIFRIYLEKKLQGASQYYDSSARLSVGVGTRYKRVLARIIQLMVEREQFGNIPVVDLEAEYYETLGDMIGEDIIFRKDLVEGKSVLDEKSEVINFTFDEFRDFLSRATNCMTTSANGHRCNKLRYI
jgi:hypothetical protein